MAYDPNKRPEKEDHRTEVGHEVAQAIARHAEAGCEHIEPPENFGITHPIELEMWERGLKSKEYMKDWREVELVFLARYCKLYRLVVEIEEEVFNTPYMIESVSNSGNVNRKPHPVHSLYHQYLNQLARAGKYLKFNPRPTELPIPYAEMVTLIQKSRSRYDLDGEIVNKEDPNMKLLAGD